MSENYSDETNKTVATTESVAHSDDYYSLHVDARDSTVGDSLYDIAEKLLIGEMENARQSLERLWALKKTTQSGAGDTVVTRLIEYYERKLNALRAREQRVRQVSENSRALIELKRRSEGQLTDLKQTIGVCTQQMEELAERLDKLRRQERELDESAVTAGRELEESEQEVLGALLEIITVKETKQHDEAAEQAQKQAVASETESSHEEKAQTPKPDGGARTRSAPQTVPEQTQPGIAPIGFIGEPGIYAKSVVKTTGGRVLGEYYYEPAVDKSLRHYVYNSRFLLEQLSLGLEMLRSDYDHEDHVELAHMLQDVRQRVAQFPNLHYETATEDIVNGDGLQVTHEQLKNRQFDAVSEFCGRLQAKLDTLGPSHRRLLRTQMDRLVGRRR